MNIRYKLTKPDFTTYNGFKWVLNEWKESDGIGELCTSGWLHCYSHSLLAILLNPIHASIENPKLFKCEVEGETLDDKGIKEGWTRMRLVEEIEIPKISLRQRTAFGILCALEFYGRYDEKFVTWANNWLNGTDRSVDSAFSIYYGVSSTPIYSFNGTSAHIVYAFRSAESAAHAAAYYASYSNNSSTFAANSYASAANSYANCAFYSCSKINLIELAEKAMQYE